MRKLLLLGICLMSHSYIQTRRIYANMVADLFHYGHVNFLRQASLLGDELVVGIVRDDLLAAYKRVPIIPQHERAKIVCACRYVTEVIEGTSIIIDETFMKEHSIDMIVHGSDFTEEKMKYYFPYAYSINAVLILPYTPMVSTTDIIRRIKERTDLRGKHENLAEQDIADWL